MLPISSCFFLGRAVRRLMKQFFEAKSADARHKVITESGLTRYANLKPASTARLDILCVFLTPQMRISTKNTDDATLSNHTRPK